MILEVSVVPNSRKFSISLKGGKVKICLSSPPENNRANIELIKELSKATGRGVRILSGAGSKRKKLEIGMSEGEWEAFLSSIAP